MKQIFKNFYAFDDKKITSKPIYVKDGIIVEKFDKADEIIDCEGLALMPAFTDLHVHFRDPGFTYKEDLETGSKAALKGGYTNVLLMGNTNPLVSSKKVYEDIMKRARDLDLIGEDQVMTITKDLDGKSLGHLDDIPEFLKFISDDGRGVDDSAIMYKAMLRAKELGLNMTLHEEVRGVSNIDYEIAEDAMTLRDCYYAYKLDMPVHFSHVSTKGAMSAIKHFKDLGAKITCEVTPHHLYFSEKGRDEMRVNPPIRREEDRKFLIKMIKEGYVDAISTDHAPHSKEDKAKGAPGFIGLETAFSTCYEVLVKEGHISLNDLISIMSTRPSKILGLNKGKIDCGYDADFVLVDLDSKKIYEEEDIVSKSKNSLMIGQKLYGSIERVYRKGVLKYENN